MSLKHAILGLLSLQPMSGYSLKHDHFDKSIANFWPADQAQIYRTLAALVSDGDIAETDSDPQARATRRTYAITDQGLETLRGWVATPHPPGAERFAFLVQLYAARHLDRDSFLTILRHQRDIRQARLDRYNEIEIGPFEEEPLRSQARFGAYTLDFGRRYEQMQLDWLSDIIRDVETDGPAG